MAGGGAWGGGGGMSGEGSAWGGGGGAGGGEGGGAAGWAGVQVDREGYALAAGFALGLVTLGAGRGASGLADMGLESRLRCVD